MPVQTDVRFTATWLEQATGGRALGSPHGNVVSTDSRQLPPDALFVALRGPTFDGHDFVEAALREGAGGVVVDEAWWGEGKDVPALVVPDTLRALQDLARAHRQRCPAPVAAVTGSNGKTSTKEFLAACLKPLGPVHKTQGNLNNHVGLPLTLLEMRETHRAAVVELGMNHAGEIDLLSRLAEPRVAVITNIAAAHLEGVKDRRGVAGAKAEIIAGLDPEGVLITPYGDQDLEAALDGARVKRVTVGSRARADYRWEDVTVGLEGTRFRVFGPGLAAEGLPVHSRLLGFHTAANITAALAAAEAMGVEPERAAEELSRVPALPGRLQLKRWGRLTVLDDTYNANPESLRQALAVLLALPARRRLAVLGDMLELGPEAERLHREAVAGMVLDGLVTFGSLSRVMQDAVKTERYLHAADHQAAAAAILEWAEEDTAVLFKGSRGMHLERVLEAVALGVEGPADAV